MKLEKFKYILKIAECGSMTKASKELYISQPSLTKIISSIEREYNIKIFERVKSGVVVTEAGKLFIEYSKDIIRNYDMLNSVFKSNNRQNKDELHVWFQQLDFMPEVILKTYKASSSKFVEFDFNKTTRYKIVEAVQKGEANIGILVRTNRESKAFDWKLSATNLDVEVLDTSDVYICVSKKSDLYNKKEIDFKDTKDKAGICLDIDSVNKEDWVANSSDVYFNFNKVIYTSSIGVAKKLLENTDVILYAHKWIAELMGKVPIRYDKLANNNKYICELIYIKRKNTILLPIEKDFIENLKDTLKIANSRMRPI